MKVRKISALTGMDVYTDGGDYFGEIEEANLTDNKIEGWRIRVSSDILSLIGGARGVIIPHNFVRAIGDIVLISKSALPSEEAGDRTPDEVERTE